MVAALVVTLVGAAIIAIWAMLLRPMRESAERKVREFSGDFGLVVTVDRDPAKMALDDLSFPVQFYFENRSSVDDPPGPLEEWWAWAHHRGGVDVGQTTVMITLQATADVAVVVDPPIIHVRDVGVCADGIIRSPEGVGGGGIQPRRFTVDLDERSPKAKYAPPSGDNRPASFSMSKGDSERIQILAHAERTDRSWWVEIPVLANGARHVESVGSERDPLVTIGDVGKPYVLFVGEAEGEDGPWTAPVVHEPYDD